MQLSEYLRIARRNWIIIAVTTLAGLIVAAAVSLLDTPIYSSHTKLFVATQNSGTVQELQQGNTFTQARVQSYAETVKTPSVLQPVIDALALDETPAQLSERVTARADIKTVIITISTTDSSPVQAAAITQAIGESLVDVVSELERPSEGGTSPVKLSVVSPAYAPTEASSPNVRLNLLAGLLGGLALGILAAVLRSVLDNRVRTETELRRVTDAALLGAITYDSDAVKKPLLTQTAHQSPRAESFRQLRTNLQFAGVTGSSKSVLVTSSIPGEGKSTTATNLAIAIAQGGQSVVLIEADLRKPRVSDYLGLERSAGLTTALVGQARALDLVQPWGPDEMYVLSSGQIPPNPSELLGAPAMKEIIMVLENSFDAVIIDAPPLLPVADAAVLAQSVGGVIVVVGSGKTKTSYVEKSLESLDLVGANLLGVAMNLLPAKGPDAYAYGYYSYAATEPSVLDSARLAETRDAGVHLG